MNTTALKTSTKRTIANAGVEYGSNWQVKASQISEHIGSSSARPFT